ncbi:hypothetical protein [Nonomuraea sp. NPDC002799]
MPRRQDGPPPRVPQPEPFETTGAFALPNDPGNGYPPANDPAGAFLPPDPMGGQAGPFETTGAFVRPSEWGPPADGPFGSERTGFFGGPDGAPGPGQPPGPFSGPSGPFAAQPGPFDGQQPPHSGQPGPFDGRQPPHAAQPGPFDGQQPLHGGQPGPFDGPGSGFFDGPGSGPFDRPVDQPFGGPADGTARFDFPQGPQGPPEPGDVKVAGEPTVIEAPAWANADTGFLRSGWSDSGSGSDTGSGFSFDEPDEPRGRRGRRKGGRRDDVLAAPPGAGKGKVALLSVAAVAVVLGGTVAGVKFMSAPTDPGQCVGTTCAAIEASTNRPGPEVSDPATEETEPQEGTPDGEAEETTPSGTPKPTASYGARTPRRTAQPTPTPTKTKVKTSAKPTKTQAPPVEESASETPSEEASTVDDDDTGVAPTVIPEPTSTATIEPGPNGQGGSVNVQQKITQRVATYKANLQVSNTSGQTLQSTTFSVPVQGRVMSVSGAEWTQDGDLLILDLPPLASGDAIDVSFTATGRGSKAGTCGMVSGECAVT